MASESQIPTASRQFAVRIACFYGAGFGLIGTHLPFFTVWLRSIGLDAGWIGIITAVPAVTRFTTLPLITSLAERRHAIRGTLILITFAITIGFAFTGTLRLPVFVFLAYVMTCIAWTPLVPLTDAYALRGVARYGLNYGRMRLSGSGAFVVGAIGCGLLADRIASEHLIFVIAAVAGLCALASLALQPLDRPATGKGDTRGGRALLTDRGFLLIIATSALIQGSHAAYYAFASINWQASGLGGVMIAGLWSLGVIGEIVIFAVSPRLTLAPAHLVVLGGISALLRWLLMAQDPGLELLALIQFAHGLTYGLTQVGTMNLLVRQVPVHLTARGQGYFAAVGGLVMSSTTILSGVLFARYGVGVYYLMAVMGACGATMMWSCQRWLAHPHNARSGG